jgi:ribose transport system permease protein
MTIAKTPPTAGKPLFGERRPRPQGWARQGTLALVLIGFVIIFSVLGTGFFTRQTWNGTVTYAAEFLILGAAETFVILSGGIDLSVGATVGLSGVTAAWTMGHTASSGATVSILCGVLVGVLTGVLMGALNGLLITVGRIPPFIATLGTLGIGSGLAYVVSGGTPISDVPDQLGTIANHIAFGWLPTLFLVAIVVLIYAGCLLRVTRFGLHVRAVGSNLRSARESGVNHRSVLFRVYLLAGILSSVAGILLMSQFLIGSPLTGTNDELNAIAAVVIGGASLSGGRGTLTGTVFGAAIISILVTGLVSLSVPAFWQVVAVGVVIVVSVFIDQIKDRAGGEV